MALIFSTFSQSASQPLNLAGEYIKLNNFFTSNSIKNKVDFYAFTEGNTADLTSILIEKEKVLKFFHFSGHSEEDRLLFNGKDFISKKVVDFFNRQNQIECIFLNGCSNKTIVDQLSKVPIVIGTKSLVTNTVAAKFTQDFFTSLIQNEVSYEEAFTAAYSAITDDTPNIEEAIIRGGGRLQKLDLNQYFLKINTQEVAIRGFPLISKKQEPDIPIINPSKLSYLDRFRKVLTTVATIIAIVSFFSNWEGIRNYFFPPSNLVLVASFSKKLPYTDAAMVEVSIDNREAIVGNIKFGKDNLGIINFGQINDLKKGNQINVTLEKRGYYPINTSYIYQTDTIKINLKPRLYDTLNIKLNLNEATTEFSNKDSIILIHKSNIFKRRINNSVVFFDGLKLLLGDSIKLELHSKNFQPVNWKKSHIYSKKLISLEVEKIPPKFKISETSKKSSCTITGTAKIGGILLRNTIFSIKTNGEDKIIDTDNNGRFSFDNCEIIKKNLVTAKYNGKADIVTGIFKRSGNYLNIVFILPDRN